MSSVAPVTPAREETQTMWDLGMAAFGVVFFAVAIFYVKGCSLLSKKGLAK